MMARSRAFAAVCVLFCLAVMLLIYADTSMLLNQVSGSRLDVALVNRITDEMQDDSNEKASQRFLQRLNHLHEMCERDVSGEVWSKVEAERRKVVWESNDNFVIVPKTSFLMCVLPKCGSSSWHQIARDMRDPKSAEREFGWQDRQKNTDISQELNEATALKILNDNDSFVAIAVRHPFGKIISGWNQKLTRGLTYASFLLEAYPLMKRFVSDKDKDHLISFADFAEYLAEYGHDVKNLDYHFLPMQYLCKPCLYPYNYVIKSESLGIDEAMLKQILHISRMPWNEKSSGYVTKESQNTVEIIRAYFKNVKKSTILKLIKTYYYDFVLFGYTFDVETFTAGGFK